MKLAKTALVTLLTFTVPGLQANAVLAAPPPATSCSALIQDLVDWEKQDTRNHVDFLMVSNKKSSTFATYTEGRLDFPGFADLFLGDVTQYFSDRKVNIFKPNPNDDISLPITYLFDPEKTDVIDINIHLTNGQVFLFKNNNTTVFKEFVPQCSNGLMYGFTDILPVPRNPEMHVISFKKVQDSPPLPPK